MGIGLTALNYIALLCWWIKHWCQSGGDRAKQTAAIPAAAPVPPVAAATLIAPIAPSVAEYHVDQPHLFLLPKVKYLLSKAELVSVISAKNVLKQGKNCMSIRGTQKEGMFT